MTTSDEPQPPGGPLRQDGAQGGFAPDVDRTGTDGPAGADGGSEERTRPSEDESPPDSVPPVTGDRPDQSDAAEAVQEENAETSLDQPSS